MINWEYKTTVSAQQQLGITLNEMGAIGWEAFQVESSGQGLDIFYTVWWKRVKEDVVKSTLLTD